MRHIFFYYIINCLKKLKIIIKKNVKNGKKKQNKIIKLFIINYFIDLQINGIKYHYKVKYNNCYKKLIAHLKKNILTEMK